MVLSSLFRRKGRTIITVVGISIGVATIIALGAVAQGLKAGFGSATRGSQADLILAQSGAVGMLLSSIDETIVDELRTWPEVTEAEGVLYSSIQAGEAAFFYVFGHDPEGFSIEHFQVIEGQGLVGDRSVSGKPIILGRRAAETANKQVGDAFHVTGGVFRIVGVYETGDAFEDGGAVLPLGEAQELTLQSRRVSVIYVKLDPTFAGGTSVAADRLKARVVRRFPDLALFTTSEFVNQEQSIQIVEGMAMAVAAVAVVIGAVVMANTLFMSVFERTHEIGVLRALGWRRGSSVAQGYWNHPRATSQVFQVYLREIDKGPFMRTGDLGFLLDGNLFVTGRSKDLIIIRGRNYYPQDIELTTESSHPGLRAGCGAAFGVDIDSTERLVVVQEVKREHRRGNTPEMLAAIRKAIFQQHQLRPYAVALIRPATIPKTSSGKIQRHAARASFLEGTLMIVDQWTQNQKDGEADKTRGAQDGRIG